MEQFPVGGPRQPVYDFVRAHGFVIPCKWSDKIWTRHDGMEVQIYNTGSWGRIIDKDSNLVADGPLAEAMAKVK